MKQLFLLFTWFLIPLMEIEAQQGFIVDHTNTVLSQIPDNWIDSAQKNLNVRYYRRSHGSQLDDGGMTALRNYSSEWAEKYNFSYLTIPGVLKLTTEYISVDYDSPLIYSNTRDFLDNTSNASTNVVMLAWSYNFYLSDIQAYLDSMENLIRDYGPDGEFIKNGRRTVPVTFVFQTACSHKDPERNIKIYEGNQLIRQHCIDYNRVLYDFADIEAYNPDGEYFGDTNPDGSYSGQNLLNDDISYNVNETTRGNWGLEWNAANPGSVLAQLSADNICTSCAHSNGGDGGDDNSRLHCVLKGQAAWWLFARLAGWDFSTGSIEATAATPLTENNLNGAQIVLNLTGETFYDDNLLFSNFTLSGAPQGCTVRSVSFTNSTSCQLTLDYNGTDFDADLTNFKIIILATELTGNSNLISNNLSIDALDENVNMSATTALTETNLNGMQISINLVDETFIDNALNSANFTLNNSPSGLSIGAITYSDNQHALLTLSFDGSDFDSDISDFNITVAASELSGNSNLNSNNLPIDAFDESVIISSASALTEINLDGMEIVITLVDETFIDNTISIENITLNNSPSGLSVNSITYSDNQHATVSLSFNGTDFDTDISDFYITVAAAELIGNSNLNSNNLTIDAIDKSITISAISALTEANLNGLEIIITIFEDTFIDNSISIENITLNNSPTGLSVNSTTYTDNQHASLNLSFDGSDFDSDISDFNITVSAIELTGNSNLTSNNITIQALDENVIITPSSPLTETNLNGNEIAVTLIDETFIDNTLDNASFVLNNSPVGLSINSITYTDHQHASLTLSFNGSDFDTDISDFDITVAASELTGNSDLNSNNLLIDAIIEDVKLATISTLQDLYESTLDGAEIMLDLKSEQFLDFEAPNGDFVLLGAPEGLTIGSYTLTSATHADLILSFNGSNFDSDSANFRIFIDKSLLLGNEDLESNKLTIYSENENNIISTTKISEIKIYPNPTNGKFQLTFPQKGDGVFYVSVINIEGKIIESKRLQLGEIDYNFNFQRLPSSIYQLLIEYKGTRIVKNFIITNN